MNTNSRLEVWFGLMVGFALTSCGGRSVLNDERPYGENGALGIDGREILPLSSAPDDVGTTPTGGTGATKPPNSSPTVTPTTGTDVTRPVPTGNPTTSTPGVNPMTTAVAPTTGVPTTTAVPTTGVPTTGTTAPSSDLPDTFPPLVPFPPEGISPNIPPEFEGIDWQDPWQCEPRLFNATDYCSVEFYCDARYSSASCSLKGGTWYCDCQGNVDYGTVQIDANAILDGEACRVGGALCASEWPAEQDQECNATNDQGRDYCSYSNTCSYEISSEANVFVSKTTQDYSYCNYSVINGREYVRCGCAYWGEFTLDWDPGSSCKSASDACSAGLDEGSQGETECTWNSSSSDLTSCQNTERCTQWATAGGIPIGLISYRQTQCYLDGANWACGCNYDGSYQYYTAGSAQEACQTASVDCQTTSGTILR